MKGIWNKGHAHVLTCFDFISMKESALDDVTQGLMSVGHCFGIEKPREKLQF